MKRDAERTRRVALILAAPLAVLAALLPAVMSAAVREWHRNAQRRTAATIRVLATACESYSIDWNQYPETGPTAAELVPLLQPTYGTLTATDGWGRPIRYEATHFGSGYRFESWGRDGVDDPDAVQEDGLVQRFPEDLDEDIVFAVPPWDGPADL